MNVSTEAAGADWSYSRSRAQQLDLRKSLGRVKPTKLDGVPVKTNGVLVYIFRRNSS
jgi:hypothetical protein